MPLYPPYPGKPRQKKAIKVQQSRFWDIMHEIEMPFIFILQRLLFAGALSNFWFQAARLASSKLLAFSPCLLYGLGYPERAKSLAKTLVCYALVSSFGKQWIVRRRPGSYEEVYCYNCAVTSSFPSRHTIGVTVLASYTPFKWPFIIFMVLDRIASGQHYLSDCLAGCLLGELSVYLANFFENPNLLTAMMLLALKVWGGGAKILGGCLPFIIAPPVVVSKAVFPICFLGVIGLRLMRKGARETNPMKILVQELFATSMTVFLMVQAQKIVDIVKDNGFSDLINIFFNYFKIKTNS